MRIGQVSCGAAGKVRSCGVRCVVDRCVEAGEVGYVMVSVRWCAAGKVACVGSGIGAGMVRQAG